MDESFTETTLIATTHITTRESECPTTLTKLMDRGVGLLAEVAVWDYAMDYESVFDLYKHGSYPYGRVSYN